MPGKRKGKRKRLTAVSKSENKKKRLEKEEKNLVQNIIVCTHYRHIQEIKEKTNVIDLLAYKELYDLYENSSDRRHYGPISIGNEKSFMESFFQPFRGYNSGSILLKQADVVSGTFGNMRTIDENGNTVTFRTLFWNRVRKEVEQGDKRSIFRKICEYLYQNCMRKTREVYFFEIRQNLGIGEFATSIKIGFNSFLNGRDPNEVMNEITGMELSKNLVNRISRDLNDGIFSYHSSNYDFNHEEEIAFIKVSIFHMNWILTRFHWEEVLGEYVGRYNNIIHRKWLWHLFVEHNIPDGLFAEKNAFFYIDVRGNENQNLIKVNCYSIYLDFKRFYLSAKEILLNKVMLPRPLTQMIVYYISDDF